MGKITFLKTLLLIVAANVLAVNATFLYAQHLFSITQTNTKWLSL